MDFYLGTHQPNWLTETWTGPLFVSRNRLTRYRRSFPFATDRWALDSGGFTELAKYGKWTTHPKRYVIDVRRYRDEIGRMDWAAPQDWMCEPFMVAKTGLSVREHQRRTLDNYLELRTLDASLPFIPVLQGWTRDDYLRHVDDYQAAGIDLDAEGRVGLGSVCRRQSTDEIGEIVASLDGLRLHGFGVKGDGIRRYGWMLASADSMAWSYSGRQVRPCPQRGVASCANCRHFAAGWRDDVLRAMSERRPVQMVLV